MKRFDERFTQLDGKTLRIVSRSEYGEVRDSLKFKSKSEVSAKIRPELLLAGVEDFAQMAVFSGCCVMANEDLSELYMVAAYD